MSGKGFSLRPSLDDQRQFTQLRLAPIAKTIVRLHRRIEARFPGSGLGRVAAELVQLAEQNEAVLRRLVHPYWWLRGLIAEPRSECCIGFAASPTWSTCIS